MFFTQASCVNCFFWTQWELDLVQRSDWLPLSLLAAGVQLMNTWSEGCSEWANSLAGHLVSNATFMNLLLAQRWPRRQQWHSTSRFRASLCFGVCSQEAIMFWRITNSVPLSCLLVGLCSGAARQAWDQNPSEGGPILGSVKSKGLLWK